MLRFLLKSRRIKLRTQMVVISVLQNDIWAIWSRVHWFHWSIWWVEEAGIVWSCGLMLKDRLRMWMSMLCFFSGVIQSNLYLPTFSLPLEWFKNDFKQCTVNMGPWVEYNEYKVCVWWGDLRDLGSFGTSSLRLVIKFRGRAVGELNLCKWRSVVCPGCLCSL